MRRDGQAAPVVGNDAHRLTVVFSDDAEQHRMTLRMKRNPFPDAKVEHLRVRPHLAEKFKPCHDAMVEIDQLRFGEPVNIDLHGNLSITGRPDRVKELRNCGRALLEIRFSG